MRYPYTFFATSRSTRGIVRAAEAFHFDVLARDRLAQKPDAIFTTGFEMIQVGQVADEAEMLPYFAPLTLENVEDDNISPGR